MSRGSLAENLSRAAASEQLPEGKKSFSRREIVNRIFFFFLLLYSRSAAHGSSRQQPRESEKKEK